MKKILKVYFLLFCIFAIFALLIFAISNKCINQKKVRNPAVAGTWYPGSKYSLESSVKAYLGNAGRTGINGTIKAIIAPHAGYAYSGQVAAIAFRQLDDIYENVFLIGPSHKYALSGAVISNYTHYKTPLGEVLLSEIAAEIKKNPYFIVNTAVEKEEHSLEMQIPFIQVTMPSSRLVPLIVGSLSPLELKNELMKYLGDKDIIIASADLSHYHAYEEAITLDTHTLGRILSLDSDGVINAEIDAPYAVSALLAIAKEKSWEPVLLYYTNSGKVTTEKSSVVGYSAVAFFENAKNELTTDEKKALLMLARKKLESIHSGKALDLSGFNITQNMKKAKGCFATLSKNNELRGCIGQINAQEELYMCVADNVQNAAMHDARFMPVKKEELNDINIEISVLSEPEMLDFSSTEEMLSKLRPSIDGVAIKSGLYQATYLPQVWEAFGTKEEFLSSLCEKAGADEGCYKQENIGVFTYQADVFSEKSIK